MPAARSERIHAYRPANLGLLLAVCILRPLCSLRNHSPLRLGPNRIHLQYHPPHRACSQNQKNLLIRRHHHRRLHYHHPRFRVLRRLLTLPLLPGTEYSQIVQCRSFYLDIRDYADHDWQDILLKIAQDIHQQLDQTWRNMAGTYPQLPLFHHPLPHHLHRLRPLCHHAQLHHQQSLPLPL